jgi:hypothetical protein
LNSGTAQDEAMNLQNLMSLGIEKVNYLKEGEEPNIGIRYISHYNPRAMVVVGNYGLAFQQNVRMKRIPAGVQTIYISGLAFGRYTFRMLK